MNKYNSTLSYLNKGVLSYFTSSSLSNIFSKKLEYIDNNINNNTEDDENKQ
jgi:hypothetical protein